MITDGVRRIDLGAADVRWGEAFDDAFCRSIERVQILACGTALRGQIATSSRASRASRWTSTTRASSAIAGPASWRGPWRSRSAVR